MKNKSLTVLILLFLANYLAAQSFERDTMFFQKKKKISILNIGVNYPLLNLNNKGDNSNKYSVISATPRAGFVLGISKAPLSTRKLNFSPECYLRYYRDILKLEDNINSHVLFEEEIKHTDLFLGFGANVLRSMNNAKTFNLELGLAFELQVTPTIIKDETFFIPAKELLYLMPVRCSAKIGFSQLISNHYLFRINYDIPLLLLPKDTNFKQNFVQVSVGYIMKNKK